MSVRVQEENKGGDEDEDDQRRDLLKSRTGEESVELVAEVVVRQHLAHRERELSTDDMDEGMKSMSLQYSTED